MSAVPYFLYCGPPGDLCMPGDLLDQSNYNAAITRMDTPLDTNRPTRKSLQQFMRVMIQTRWISALLAKKGPAGCQILTPTQLLRERFDPWQHFYYMPQSVVYACHLTTTHLAGGPDLGMRWGLLDNLKEMGVDGLVCDALTGCLILQQMGTLWALQNDGNRKELPALMGECLHLYEKPQMQELYSHPGQVLTFDFHDQLDTEDVISRAHTWSQNLRPMLSRLLGLTHSIHRSDYLEI